MEVFKTTIIIIPSLSPDERLLETIKAIKAYGFYKIIIVNDGSTSQYDEYFNQAGKLDAIILKHNENKGKGRALKTAFSYVLKNYPECTGVVTADSDGQHRAEDIYRCAKALRENAGALVLGSRDFKKEDIPFKSRYGNIITCKVFSFFTGISVSDTQTGLRAIPVSALEALQEVEGERFEYETNMLLKTKDLLIPIIEVPIETIYIEENKNTHFKPIIDSIKIFSLFFKFILSSLTSFVVDIFLFSILTHLLKEKVPDFYILIATAVSRVVSSLYNYSVNKVGVFGRGTKDTKGSLLRYYALAVIQMAASAGLVWAWHVLWPLNETVIKIAVDCMLFLISFQIQREWVFKKK